MTTPYKLHRLDGRHSHNDRFRYYLGYANSMANKRGPLHFNDALTWFIQTYGWSAEVHQTHKIQQWSFTARIWQNLAPAASGILEQEPEYCNPHWSWSNLIGNELRIYMRDDAVLSFWQLSRCNAPEL